MWTQALTLHALKKVRLYMRSYPLLGLFLATRHAVSKMTSSPAILRPTATGISLLFLSLKHSAAAIEVRVIGVTGWPQYWEVILPLPASAWQRRKPRDRQSFCASHLLPHTETGENKERVSAMIWNVQCLWSLMDYIKMQIPSPHTQEIMTQWVGGEVQGILMQLRGRSNFGKHWFGLESQDKNYNPG